MVAMELERHRGMQTDQPPFHPLPQTGRGAESGHGEHDGYQPGQAFN
jgi:hypothetical protein